jgi:hypothetical protein
MGHQTFVAGAGSQVIALVTRAASRLLRLIANGALPYRLCYCDRMLYRDVG